LVLIIADSYRLLRICQRDQYFEPSNRGELEKVLVVLNRLMWGHFSRDPGIFLRGKTAKWMFLVIQRYSVGSSFSRPFAGK